MKNKIDTAVILAAGMGSRLKQTSERFPKGFLVLGEKPIVEESILKLESIGVIRIVIVTGYMDSYYQELSLKYNGLIEIVHNHEYEVSGSMYSLYCARFNIKTDFILLESDIIYERRALEQCLVCKEDNVIIVSGETFSGDEVYVESIDKKLTSMSKCKDELNGFIVGELVGISKISLRLYEDMCDFAEYFFKKSKYLDYETDCLVGVSSSIDISVYKIDDLIWSEIDDESHLKRAIAYIYPKITNM